MSRRRIHRALIATLMFVIPVGAADNALVFSRTLGGNGSSVAALTVDPAGNVIVAGSTGAFDFQVTNGSFNPGTALATSLDSGRTWRPLGDVPAGIVATLAIDAGGTLYAGSTAGVFRSTDRGKSWTAAAAIPGLACGSSTPPFCRVTALATGPGRASVLYAGANTGIFKTVDGGNTWAEADNGIATIHAFDYLVIDSFHPEVLYTSFGTNYRSFDGGKNWATYDLPHVNTGGLGGTGDRVAFDPFTPGTIYNGSYDGLFISTDAGVTWTHSTLAVPVLGVAADPITRGVIYAVDANPNVYRSVDGGATFTRVYQDNSGSRLLVLDPFHTGVVLTSTARSEDGGQNWSRLSLGRAPRRLLFDPKNPGVVYSASDVSSDAFVAKLDSSGQNILFATYLGGTGNESVAGVATDPAGNIYIAGTTSSTDFPVTSKAALKSDPSGGFVAKFDSSGTLIYATFVPARVPFPQSSALAVGPDGGAVFAGFAPTLDGRSSDCLVTKLSPDGATFDFVRRIGSGDDLCAGVAVDGSNNIAVTGYTSSQNFPVTDGAIQPSLKFGRHAFLAKLDSNGNTLMATYLGGSDDDSGAAVAFDAAGNMVVAGTTASKDFITTPGAYQRSLRANCPYPSSAVSSGFIGPGLIVTYRMDDAFVMKLDPSGKKILFSTFLGGDCYDVAKGISLDSWGNVWVTGTTNSNQFPMAFPFESGPAYAQYKAFATRLDATGSTIYFSSYYTAGENPVIAATYAGDAYVGGSTRPPTPPFADGSPPPSTPLTGFLAKIGPPPSSSMAIISVGNAFTLRNGPVSAGELTLIDVVGMADVDSVDLGFHPTAPLPTQLGRAQVFFEDEPAAIVSVTQGRILCVAPYDLAGKTTTRVTVVAQGERSPALVVNVNTTDVGIRTVDGSGQGQALALNQDGTLNSPDNPAARGSMVTFFVTGTLPPASCPYGGSRLVTAGSRTASSDMLRCRGWCAAC